MEYTVHTPSFRYHDLPYQDCLNKVGTVTLQDYRDDLVALIESLNQPPLLLGHSLGFLVAQMAAKKAMPPYKKEFFKYCMNEQEESLKEEVFTTLVSESGKVYTQMALH